MNLRELVTLFRSEVDDLSGTVADPCAWENDDTGLLWSNADAVRYANQAVDEFCRRVPIVDHLSDTDGLSPASDLCLIPIVADQADYTLHPKILHVRRIVVVGERNPLTKATIRKMDKDEPNWENATAQDPPTHYIEDFEERTIRVWPTPTATATGNLRLTVARMPLKDMQWALRQTEIPEIEEKYHRDLIDYMQYRAYRKRDAETYKPEISISFLENFTANVGTRPSARIERERREERNHRRRSQTVWF